MTVEIRQTTAENGVAVAMIGSRRGYVVPRALHSAGALAAFYTDIWADVPWAVALSSLPLVCNTSAVSQLVVRKSTEIPRQLVFDFPVWGLMRLFRRSKCQTAADRWRFYGSQNSEFGSLVVRHWPKRKPKAFYAFNAAALEIFEKSKDEGVGCVLDQTAAPWRYDERLLAEERRRWPGWEETGDGEGAEWRRLADREEREWVMADRIVCGSQYVVECVRKLGGPAEKCVVIPYPIEQDERQRRIAEEKVKVRPHDELRVLFVGTLCLRKGIQYLTEAARLLGCDQQTHRVKIRAVGSLGVTREALRKIAQVIEVHPPVDRQNLLAHYRWADVLVLPTLSEGSANVCYEALAVGLPVITTLNAGSVVTDGVEGLIVQPGSSLALKDSMESLLPDPKRVAYMSQKAVEKASALNLASYAARLCAVTLVRTE